MKKLDKILVIAFLLIFYFVANAQKKFPIRGISLKTPTDYYRAGLKLLNYTQEKGKFADFDDVLKIAKKGLSLTKPADLKNLAGLHFLVGMTYKIQLKNDSAIYHLTQSILNAREANEVDIEVTGTQQINYLFRYLGMVERTSPYIARLNVLVKQVKDINLKDKIVSALSDDFLHRGAYTRALELLLGSLNTKEYLYNREKDYKSKINLGLAFSELGSLYLQLNQNQNALNYLKKGAPYFTEYIGGRVRLYKKLLRAYLNIDRVDSATGFYNKVYAVMQPGVYESAEDISDVNRLFAEYYLNTGNISTASKYAERAYAKGIISESEEAILMSIYMMGNLSYQQKKYAKAINYLEQVLPNSKNFNKDVFSNINLRLAQCYENLGNYKKANIFYNKYNLLRDEIFIEKTKEEISAIEFKYKNAQKEHQINTLNFQSKVQRKEIRQQKWFQSILIIAILLAFIAAGLAYHNFRNKKKANELLANKNEQLDSLNTKLSASNQTKAKLFGIISHDLRTPISQLFSFLKLQQVSNLISEEEKSHHQQDLIKSSTLLLDTMEDLLLWSKSQMEQFQPDLEEIDVADLFTAVIPLMQTQADERHIKITTQKLEFDSVTSDYNLLAIVLRNLLQNAINNSFEHTTILLDSQYRNSKKEIVVLNQGEVIPADKIKDLMCNINIKSKSSGYGLVIINELVEKIGATLTIKSSATAGTEIKVIFE